MRKIGYPEEKAIICYDQIIATQHHKKSVNSDTNYLLDADLSILGKPWDIYLEYVKNIRKEYSIYPDLLYKPGRKKVVNQLLALPELYKTEWFKNQFENQARENLQKELDLY